MPDARYYVHYQDDGPNRPGGQDMRTTMPWNRLHVFETPKQMLDFIHDVKHSDDRRNSRVTGYWSDTDDNYPLLADWTSNEAIVAARSKYLDSNDISPRGEETGR